MNDDWRLHLSTRLAKAWRSPWTGEVAPAGSRIVVVNETKLSKKKTLTIPLPNATALFLSSSARAYNTARKLRAKSNIDKSRKHEVSFESEESAFDYYERMIESIVMAYSSLESFANEIIPDNYNYEHYRKSDVILEVYDKTKIERYVSLDDKLSKILPSVLDCKSPRGKDAWSQFKSLKKVRDRIIHMKSSDRRSSGRDKRSVWDAITTISPPPIMAKTVITHYLKDLKEKPRWFAESPI